jgi:hypothetical protein
LAVTFVNFFDCCFRRRRRRSYPLVVADATDGLGMAATASF